RQRAARHWAVWFPARWVIRELLTIDLEQLELTTLEAVIRRDRAVTAAGLVGLAALAWAWVVRMAAPAELPTVAMAGMPGMDSGHTPGLPWLAGLWGVLVGGVVVSAAGAALLVFG